MAAEASNLYNRSAKGTVKDEFFVNSSGILLISQYKEKIEKMYAVQLHFEEITEGGQWLIFEGESVDRRNAKTYFKAICNPAEKKKVQFPTSACMELTDPVKLEYIEMQTNAFIRPLEKIAQFEICGTELAVTLALSLIEELIGEALKDGEQFDDAEDTADEPSDGLIKISSATRDGSSRLNRLLERTLLHNSDGGYPIDDYRKMKPVVQRALVSCLQNDEDNMDNIENDLLFAERDSADLARKTDFSAYYDDDQNVTQNTSTTDGKTSIRQPKQNSPTGRQFIADPAEPSELLKQHQTYLRTFGLSVGFTEHHVEAVIGQVNEKTRPSDFLDMLNSLPSEVNISNQSTGISNDSSEDAVVLSTEIVDSVTGETKVVNEVPKGNKTSSKKLADDHAERRFVATEGNCSIEELKKRNAERQKLLKENFEKQQNQQSEPKKGKKKGNKNKGQQVQTQPQRPGNKKAPELRYIVIDGSNVAMEHGNGKLFSCKGIKLCVDFFRQRGHTDITVIVPHCRQYKPSDKNNILDQPILYELKKEGNLEFAPARKIRGKLVASYDDRFILELAERTNGIIISNDHYRDLMTEKAAWRKIIEERLLQFMFVKDHFMPSEEPLGRNGPRLDEFLQDRTKKYLQQGLDRKK